MQVTRKVIIVNQEELDKSLERILLEVIRLAIRDYRQKRNRLEVLRFLYSSFFEDIMDHFNRNPKVDRRKILSGKTKRIRDTMK